jgi:hypothetical protein
VDTVRTGRPARLARSLAIVAIVALGLTACARATGPGSDGSATPGPISHPFAANELLLRVEDTGGFIAPEALLQRYPIFSLYGDGTVITEGAQIAIYPPPALPALIATHVSEAGVQRILRAAIAAGLGGPSATYGGIRMPDAPDTVFTLNLHGRTHAITVTALGMGSDGTSAPPGEPGSVAGGTRGSTGSAAGTIAPRSSSPAGPTGATRRLSRDEARARAALYALETKLAELRSWLPAGSVGEDAPYEPTAMRVYVTDGAPGGPGGALHEPDVTWPLATPLAAFGAPIPTPLAGGPTRCGVVDGPDLLKLLRKVEVANELSPWVSEGRRFALSFRPLLPDESGC